MSPDILIHLVAAGVNTELGPVCLITKLLPGCRWYIQSSSEPHCAVLTIGHLWLPQDLLNVLVLTLRCYHTVIYSGHD